MQCNADARINLAKTTQRNLRKSALKSA